MMASSNAGASIGIGYNKENSEKEDGIEAQDLATLLSRFEEATSSDDLNLPQAVHKTKWNIMKAKSAGNSPAATPPATPPPTQNNRFGPIRLNTFTKTPPVVMNNQKPMQLTIVKPTAVSSQFSTLSVPSSVTNKSSFTKISTTSLIPPKPKIQIQLSSNSSLPSSPVFVTLAGGQQQSRSANSSPQMSPVSIIQKPLGILKKTSSVSLATASNSTPQKRVIHIPIRSSKYKNSVQTTGDVTNTLGIDEKKQTLNVIRLPALDAASSVNFTSSTVKQIIPKKRVSTLPSAIELEKKRRLDSSNSSLSSTTSLLPKQSPMLAAHLTSSVIKPNDLPYIQSLKTIQTLLSLPRTSSKCSTQSAGSKLNLPNALTLTQNVIPKVSQPPTEVKFQRDEHTYAWSGPCFNNKNSQRIGLSSSVVDSSSATDSSSLVKLESEQLSENGVVEAEVVLEEGEVYVDANGNDLFSKETANVLKDNNNMTLLPSQEMPNRVVCFDTGDKTLRRARRYRRQDLSNSPVREDKSDFFDKIPSHYTALAIPAKQIRKTVFESVSRSVGSQDHLAMPATVEEPEDDGQYNKVPIHHRIFTNTTEDVELPGDIEPGCSGKEDNSPRGRSSRVRRISSTSRHSGHSASSHRSYRSGSRHSRSRSRSPAYSDHSPVDNGRGRPLTRRRRNSSSQLSTSSYSSSCSSGSYCSTCGASLSRSRSRSYSSDRSRERSYSPQSNGSRSRSRSPRGFRRRRRISGRSATPDHSRSRSRSQSPFRRRRNSYRTSSRSRRHQMKERSSAERRIMESRKQREDEKVKAMEERRVLYVGKLPDNFSKHQLRKRFEQYGEILSVRLNFRVHGDNYGFVTFAYACDAFAAKEKGNNNLEGQPRFDLCFGGRRRFCPDKYADLDGNREIEEEYAPMSSSSTGELDYAALLKQHVNQQKKRK